MVDPGPAARLLHPDNLPVLGLLLLFPLLAAATLALARRQDRRRQDLHPAPAPIFPPRVSVWPHLLKRELAAALAITTLLILWSILADAPLERPADPAEMANPAKAPWYFVGLQELLVYFDPWIAGVTLPLLIALGLALLPYLDPNPRGEGCWTIARRPLALTLFLGGFSLWTLLIGIGAFCRGPGWAWFWPWEEWNTERAALTRPLRSLPEALGVPPGAPAFLAGLVLLALWFWGVGRLLALLLDRLDPQARPALGRRRFFLLSFLLAAMLGVVAKIALRLALDIDYVLVVPWLIRANI